MDIGAGRPRAWQRAAPAGGAAIASLGLVLLIVQLIDVFVRRQWVSRDIGVTDVVTTTMPVAPLPFLWPGDEGQLLLATIAMLVLGGIGAGSAVRSVWRAGKHRDLIPAAGRHALMGGIAAASAQLVVLSDHIVGLATGSTCDTVRLLPWLQLSAVLGLIGAAVALRSLLSTGEHASARSLKRLSLGGATIGLAGATIGLCASAVVLPLVVTPQCPW